MSREVTPLSAASSSASRTSRVVVLPASCRNRMRAAIRDFRQERSKVRLQFSDMDAGCGEGGGGSNHHSSLQRAPVDKAVNKEVPGGNQVPDPLLECGFIGRLLQSSHLAGPRAASAAATLPVDRNFVAGILERHPRQIWRLSRHAAGSLPAFTPCPKPSSA